MGQWQQEMKKHFNELFHIYDTDYINTVSRTFARLEVDNEINLFTQHKQTIVSMDAAKHLQEGQTVVDMLRYCKRPRPKINWKI